MSFWDKSVELFGGNGVTGETKIVHVQTGDEPAEEEKIAAVKLQPDGSIIMCAGALLKRAAGDYGNRIFEVIKDDVIEDVMGCIAYKESGGFTQEDVQLTIGRAICTRIGIEV